MKLLLVALVVVQMCRRTEGNLTAVAVGDVAEIVGNLEPGLKVPQLLREGTYVVLAPAKVRPGMQYGVCVNILHSTGGVVVTATMIRTNDNSQVASAIATVRQGNSKVINLQIPDNLPSGAYSLNVSGTGGLSFSNSTALAYSSKAMSIFIQTDKAMYKPGQTVNFRVLGMTPDLSVYRGALDIDIQDAHTNKIKQWLAVVGTQGVFTERLDLSSQPVLGDWKISVRAGNENAEKVFTVAEYVLPKFEVKVELPSYVLDTANDVPVKVEAKYTYGKPVSGPVSLNITVDNIYYYQQGSVTSIQQTAQLDSQGVAQLTVLMSELKRLDSYLPYKTLRFTADVTESLTGITLNGTSTVKVYNSPFTVEFPSSNPKTFKPGLNYIGHVRVTQPDGLPVASASGQTLTVRATATIERSTVPQTTVATSPAVSWKLARIVRPYPYPTTTSRELTPVSVVLGNNGMGEFQFTVPSAAISVSLQTDYQGVTGYSSLGKTYSPSNNYIQLYLKNTTNTLQAGDQATFEFKATENVRKLVYQVISRGSIVATGVVNGHARNQVFSLVLTSAMAPYAHMIASYVRADAEIVADSISFSVKGVFRNKVSVSMSKSEAAPADSVNVTVHASPESTAYLLAVDQSVLLLKSGNDITADQVEEQLNSYNSVGGNNPDYPEPIPFFRGGPIAFARRKRSIIFPYPRPYGGSDASSTIRNTGLVALTDCYIYKYIPPRVYYPTMAFRGQGANDLLMAAGPPLAIANAAPVPVVESDLMQVERIRNVFPETWLWTNATVGANGMATVTTTVPDTITSWITSGFAVHDTDGLGIAPTAAKLRVFKPFFVTLNLPYSVVRGEQVVIQAIVFNYMDTDQNVRVTLKMSSSFQNILLFANGTEELVSADQFFDITVAAGEGKGVFFPIVTKVLGNSEIQVSARSTQAADAELKYLLVKAEGIAKAFSISVLVDLKNTSTFTQTVPVPALPPNLVPDSVSARISAVGDLMGSSLNGLDSLVQMPTGCGEQNMLFLAPDVFIYAYLEATNQLGGDLAQKAIKYMESGYQRELTYQHKDGSFSAFGESDASGSMWLTAFVGKTFQRAKKFIYIDLNVITRAMTWMVDRQNPDGSFPEPGRVIHTNMQGGAASGSGLTAFVTIAMLESRDDLPASIKASVEVAIKKALVYLKQQLSLITDDYILAMTTYALTLANDADATNAFNRLLTTAVMQDGLRYWHKADSPAPSGSATWQSPQATSSDIEITSYGLLTYAARNDFINSLSVLKWVTLQSNPNGGYSSTQDTVLAIQACAAIATLIYSSNFNMDVDVTAGPFTKQFTIERSNALVYQMAEVPSVPTSLTVVARGSGIALISLNVYFHVGKPVEKETFAVTVNLTIDQLNHLQIYTCVSWLGNGTSGMAIQEVGIPSGFEVDVDKMADKNKLLKRTEVQDNKVVLYFDEIGPQPVCTTLDARRTGLVAKSQPVPVTVKDYYQPDKQATVFYESAVLKSSSVCDVCPECSCPAR